MHFPLKTLYTVTMAFWLLIEYFVMQGSGGYDLAKKWGLAEDEKQEESDGYETAQDWTLKKDDKYVIYA
jgi:hypothetical protein